MSVDSFVGNFFDEHPATAATISASLGFLEYNLANMMHATQHPVKAAACGVGSAVCFLASAVLVHRSYQNTLFNALYFDDYISKKLPKLDLRTPGRQFENTHNPFVKPPIEVDEKFPLVNQTTRIRPIFAENTTMTHDHFKDPETIGFSYSASHAVLNPRITRLDDPRTRRRHLQEILDNRLFEIAVKQTEQKLKGPA